MRRKGKGLFKALITIVLIITGIVMGIRILFPMKYMDEINEYSEKYGLEPALVCAVINTESHFEENAVSAKGASGLMQIMKPTADWTAKDLKIEGYSYDRIFEPKINIEIGCRYLSYLMNCYNGDMTKVTAAYNAGQGNVDKWLYDENYSRTGEKLDRIPFKETSEYVERVQIGKKIYEIQIEIAKRLR